MAKLSPNDESRIKRKSRRGAPRRDFLLAAFSLESFVYHVPVDDLPQSIQMVRTTVLVVDVIGVLPNVESQQGLEAALYGVAGIGLLRDLQFAVFVDGEPHPA